MPWKSDRDYGNSRGGYSRDERPEPQRYPNSGGLFRSRNKRSQNSPDLYGSILIADEVLDYILREAEGGNEVMLELSAWEKIARDNSTITSIKINIPYQVRQEMEGNQTFRRPSPNRALPNTRPIYGREPPSDAQKMDNSYAGQSAAYQRRPIQGVTEQQYREKQIAQRNADFARGDRMPSFLDDDGEDPPF